MQKKEIQHEVNANRITLFYRRKNGDLLKESYIFYSLAEAKNQFFNKYKDIF